MKLRNLIGSIFSLRTSAPWGLALLLASTSVPILADGLDCSKYPAALSAGPDLSDGSGWNQAQYYSTIQTADIDGDGQDELAARAGDGMHFWHFDRTSNSWKEMTPLGTPYFTNASGWSSVQNYSTIQFAALTKGSSQADLIARADDGIHIYRYNTTSLQWSELATGVRPFPDAAVRSDGTGTDWAQPQYYSTIQTADIDGDGVPELIGRGATGLQVWHWDSGKNTWTGPTLTGLLSDANGYDQAAFYTPLFFVDLDGDGHQKLVVRTDSGLQVFNWTGNAFTVYSTGFGPFSTSAGYSAARFYSSIRVFVDANHQAWAVAQEDGSNGGDSGALAIFEWDKTYKNWTNSSSVQLPGGGWDQPGQYSTVLTADIDGDGQMEILVRGSDGLHAFHGNNLTWTELPGLIANFNDASGFNLPQSYATIQTVKEQLAGTGVTTPQTWILARGPSGIQTLSYGGGVWGSPGAGFPAWPNTDQQKAYAYISTNILSTSTDIRSQYTDVNSLSGDWTRLQTQVANLKGLGPPSIPADAFEAVRQVLYTELGNVAAVRAWFTNNTAVMSYVYGKAGDLLPTVTAGVQLSEGSSSEAAVVLEYLALAFDVVSKILSVIPEVEAGAKVAELLQTTMEIASAASAGDSGSDAINAKVFEVGTRVASQQDEFTIVNACKQVEYLQNPSLMQSLVATPSPWIKPNPTEVADAQVSGAKGLELWMYQSISPAAWEIWRCDPTNYYYQGCPLPAFPTKYVFTLDQTYQYSYILEDHGHNNVPAADVLKRIFGSDGLGASVIDVYISANGWNLPGDVFIGCNAKGCRPGAALPAYVQCRSGCPPPNDLGAADPAVATAIAIAQSAPPVQAVDPPVQQALSPDELAKRDAIETAVRQLRDDVVATVPAGPNRERLVAPLRETLRYLRKPNGTATYSSAASMLRFFILREQIRQATPIAVQDSNRHRATAYAIQGMFTDPTEAPPPLAKAKH